MTQTLNRPPVSIKDVLAAVTHAYQPITVGEITMDTFRPVTLSELLIIAKRNPGILEFMNSALNISGTSTKNYSDKSLYDLIADAGPEACAAIVAASAGLINDLDFQRELTQKPDDFFLPVLAHVIDITIGGTSIDDFFTRVVGHFVKVRAFKGLEKPKRQAPTAANKATRPGKKAA